MIEINNPERSSHGDVSNFLSKSLPPSVNKTSGIAIEYPNSHANPTADHDLSLVSDGFFFFPFSINLNKKEMPRGNPFRTPWFQLSRKIQKKSISQKNLDVEYFFSIFLSYLNNVYQSIWIKRNLYPYSPSLLNGLIQ